MHTEDLAPLLRQHPFLADLPEQHITTLIGCASNVHFAEGSQLLREGELADKFYLIRTGRVALEIDLSERGQLRIQTVGSGEVLGWSWLISPFRWHFTGVAVTDVRGVALDGKCLRLKSENDHDFGYEMLKRLAIVMERRLEATRLQIIDVYGSTPEVGL
ncbi:MAG TPA: cyclic nucleotide-binding domain-containing protein [Bacteroidota bacterium]|jgi:CRP-like cAMP-binding protein